MAINLDTNEGKALKACATALHERRTGRSGGRKWNPQSRANESIRPPLDLLWDYYEGNPPLSRVHRDWAPHFREFVRMGQLNIAELTITSTGNRIDLRDFKTAAADDEVGDVKAREIMRANRGELVAADVHDWFLALGDAYTLTRPPKESAGEKHSRITAEDPREMITLDDPETSRPRWGFKLYRGEWDDKDVAFLYYPDGRIRRATCEGRTTITRGPFRFDDQRWSFDDGDPLITPGGRFPIVHFRNRHGKGEFEAHLWHLDRLNDKIFNEWWIAKIQAFRQRAIKNLPEVDERTGEEIDYTDMFIASPDATWQVPEGVEFWESTPVNLDPIINSIKQDLERFASAVAQPLHTITPDAASGSAEGATLMREEHLYKIGNRIKRLNSPWAETMSLAFAFGGDEERADITQIEAIWGPTERHSLQQKADAAQKLNAGSQRPALPIETIWTDVLQYPPAEVPNLRSLAGAALMFQRPGQAPATQPGV